jgi:hypothetical protein
MSDAEKSPQRKTAMQRAASADNDEGEDMNNNDGRAGHAGGES